MYQLVAKKVSLKFTIDSAAAQIEVWQESVASDGDGAVL